MAKYLKSFFQPDKKRNHSYEGSSEEDKEDFPPPLEGRRKLSVSRSGRMRHAQKKRNSLSLDIYKENQNQPTPERPKTQEYYVNPATCSVRGNVGGRRRSTDSKFSAENDTSSITQNVTKHEIKSWVNKDTGASKIKTPEEEIDSAFEIIDKS